jgi:hypothetical protein
MLLHLYHFHWMQDYCTMKIDDDGHKQIDCCSKNDHKDIHGSDTFGYVSFSMFAQSELDDEPQAIVLPSVNHLHPMLGKRGMEANRFGAAEASMLDASV